MANYSSDDATNSLNKDKSSMTKISKYTYALKFIGPAVATSLLAYSVYKGKGNGLKIQNSTEFTKSVLSNSGGSPENVFGGLKESTLDRLAKDTNRGIKAIVKGDTLEYFYKSASGKSTNVAEFHFDEIGRMVGTLGNGPYFNSNAPRFFSDKVLEKIKSI